MTTSNPYVYTTTLGGATGSASINASSITGIASGSSPTYTISNGLGTNYNWANIAIDNSLKGDTLKVSGNADITGELTIQGVNLSDRLDKIEERLGILRPNEELEEKWEQLRGLRKAYLDLEAEIKEKELVWAILNK